MRRLTCWVGWLCVVGGLAGCQAPGPATRTPTMSDDLAALEAYLCGSFSSAEQAAADPNNFLDIRLHITPIWEGKPGGPWLYVEQAAATALDRPYRQRVYQLVCRDGGVYESRVYELPAPPLRFAGAWKEPATLDSVAPADLRAREGCTVIMKRRADGVFVGGTEGTGCTSTIPGAAYVTSEVTLTPDSMTSWDRIFNSEGVQVRGATAGGYRFQRVRE